MNYSYSNLSNNVFCCFNMLIANAIQTNVLIWIVPMANAIKPLLYLIIPMANAIKPLFCLLSVRWQTLYNHVAFYYCNGKRYKTYVFFKLLRWQMLYNHYVFLCIAMAAAIKPCIFVIPMANDIKPMLFCLLGLQTL